MPHIERANGSGFIVGADGYIVTNKHVVEDAYSITVILADGQALQAAIAYESPVIDVAFLKVEAGRPLLAATLARGDALRLGQQVVAIGNPEGLGISASAGIVSALDRDLKSSPYDHYVQTDAAINPGNSGGPLFDLAGEVVGMNSLSWAAGEDGGSNGLGFAIPSSSISFLIDRLKTGSDIRCGTLGLKGQKLTATMRDALRFPGYNGVIIATVDQNSMAERVGLKPGDVIESLDGEKLYDVSLLNRLSCFALGRSVSLQVWRAGKTFPLQVVIADAEDVTGATTARPAARPRFASARDLGMTVALVDDRTRRRFRLGKNVTGFVITGVRKPSEADQISLGAGDVIKSLQMVPLTGGTPFDEVLARLAREDRNYVMAMIGTKGGDRWVTLPVHLEGAQAK